MTHLDDIRARIAAAAKAAGRDPASVALVGISKQQPPEAVDAVLAAGHRLFGENRVQEALARWPSLKERFPDVRVRLVGALQSNKAGEAVAFFDAIDSLDRPKLASALADAVAKAGRAPDVLIRSTPAKSRRRRESCLWTPTRSSRSPSARAACR